MHKLTKGGKLWLFGHARLLPHLWKTYLSFWLEAGFTLSGCWVRSLMVGVFIGCMRICPSVTDLCRPLHRLNSNDRERWKNVDSRWDLSHRENNYQTRQFRHVGWRVLHTNLLSMTEVQGRLWCYPVTYTFIIHSLFLQQYLSHVHVPPVLLHNVGHPFYLSHSFGPELRVLWL